MIRKLFIVGLFVLFSPLTCYYVPNLINFGKLSSPAPADFVQTVQSKGVPMVRRIKRYQRDTGQLPGQISDLIPKYMALSQQSFGVQVMSGDQFVMFGEFNHQITYDFTPGAEGWSVHGPAANGPIPIPPVTLAPDGQPTDEP